MNIHAALEGLTTRYPWQKFKWGLGDNPQVDCFEEWVWRYSVGCTLCANEREASVLKVTPLLFAQYPTAQVLSTAEVGEVAQILEKYIDRSAMKAKRLIEAAKLISERGIPSSLDDFMALPGIGYHMACVLQATCFDQPEFAIDVHVRRIMKRLGLVPEHFKDKQIETYVREVIPSTHWGHFSRSFVDFGQQICGFRPQCKKCPFTEQCPKKG